MTSAGPLRWATGAGWLVLVGGGEWAQAVDISEQLLASADLSLPIAFLPTAGESTAQGERLLEYFADLGGPRGYVVPVLERPDARDPENQELLAGAGMVILGDGDPLKLADVLPGSAALEGVAEAFVGGASVVGVGAGAAFLGQWMLASDSPDEVGCEGCAWVGGAVVAPRFVGAAEESDLRDALRKRPGLIGIGVPERTALALGPDGQVETWGEEEVTVVVAR